MTRWRSIWCCALMVALFSATPSGVLADPQVETEMKPDARRHLEEGLRLYERGAYAEAIAAFERGWAIDPQPDFLYALGQAERLRGDCKKAIEHYAAFVLRVRSDTKAAAARLQIQRCDEELNRPHEVPVSASPTAPVRRAEPATSQPDNSRGGPPISRPRPVEQRWYEDVPGGLLVGVGLAATIVGSVLYVQADGTISDATESYDAYTSARDAEPRRTAGIIVGGAGAALFLGGVVRYVWVGSRDGNASVGVVPVERGASLRWAGRF